MRPDERCYYERRAEAELDLAQKATHPCAVKAHYQLASLYLDRMIERREDRRSTTAESRH